MFCLPSGPNRKDVCRFRRAWKARPPRWAARQPLNMPSPTAGWAAQPLARRRPATFWPRSLRRFRNLGQTVRCDHRLRGTSLPPGERGRLRPALPWPSAWIDQHRTERRGEKGPCSGTLDQLSEVLPARAADRGGIAPVALRDEVLHRAHAQWNCSRRVVAGLGQRSAAARARREPPSWPGRCGC